MGFLSSPRLLTCSVKRLVITAAFVPALSFAVLSPCYSASADQGGSSFANGLFPFGKKKTVESQTVQMSPQPDSRVTDLQQQVRELTGKVEELNFMVLQMQEQLRQLQQGGGAAAPSQQPAQEPKKQSQAVEPQSPASETGAKQEMPRAASTTQSAPALPGVGAEKNAEQKNINAEEAPKDLGSIEFDKNGNILNGSVNQNAVATGGQGQATQSGSALPTAPQTTSAKELYDIGYKNILSGDYRAAEADFRAFQERYSTDPQIADASFWLGESLFGQKRYREAAQAYIDVQRNYKDSPRGPENLLKLGMSMAHLDEQKVACATFAEVTKRYKTVDPAVLKRVKDEQSRNKCQ